MKTQLRNPIAVAAALAVTALSWSQASTPGLQYATFNTPSGQIKVALTNDLAAGAQFTGTVIASPNGKTEAEREKNEGVLRGMVVETAGSKAKVGDALKFAIPALSTGMMLHLFDSKGKSMGAKEMPVQVSPPVSVPNFEIPPLVERGGTFSISGPCNGDTADTALTIGGVKAPVLAESPWQAAFQCPSDVTPGPQALELEEGNQKSSGATRAYGVTLRAQNTLTIGQTTPLQILVQGMEGYDQPATLRIFNGSPNVVRLDAGAHAAAAGNVVIALTPFGASERSRELPPIAITALVPGGFEIKAELMGGGQCGATTHEMKIHGPSKTNDKKGYHVKWKEQCQLGTCYLKPEHSGSHAYAWRTCKDHAEVEHDLVYDNKEDRDAKYRDVETDRDKRQAEHKF